MISVCICLFVYIYYKTVWSSDKKLKCFPCPPGVPILGNALDFVLGKSYFSIFNNFINKYGDIVLIKIGPTRRMLLSANYNIFQLLTEDGKILKKPPDYKVFYRWIGNGLSVADGVQWKRQHRIISPTFNNNILASFVEVFESNAKILIKKFANHLGENSVDIYEMSNLCTLDIICETAMGTSINAQENSDCEYVQGANRLLNIVIRRMFSFFKMNDLLYQFTYDYKEELKTVKLMNSFTENAIKNRQNKFNSTTKLSKQKRKAFLDHLLEANHNGEQLTLEEIKNNVNAFMFAGHETTGTAISFILFCLANYPEVQRKVFKEQEEIFGDNFERNATFQDLQEMKYLENVIKESLRLYPSAAYVVKVLTEDVPFEGTVLPKDLVIIFFYYALMRNPKYFSEPDKFMPERFQNGGKIPFAFMPFSIGPRNCIGQKYAMLEMKTVISRIVRTFELSPSIPAHELKIEALIFLTSTNGVRLSFKKRK